MLHYGSIKYERLDGLTADTNFTLPAGHTPTAVIVRNNAMASRNFDLRFGGNAINSGSINAPATGLWSGLLLGGTAFRSDSDETLEIFASNWSSVNLDVIVVMVDTSI